MIPTQVIYVGYIMHKRLIPKEHKFKYKFFSLFLDIDDLEKTQKKLRFFSLNKFNLLSFYQKDHGPRDGSRLRPWLDKQLEKSNMPRADKVFLLSFPRMFGYVFNPFSAYFCYTKNSLSSIVYEVKNTFGDQILYIREANEDKENFVMHSHRKEMYVSPFIEMEQIYEFVLKPPSEKLNIKISQSGSRGRTLVAKQTGNAIELNSANLLKCVVRNPLMTLKVIVGIHWEALILVLKGIKLQRHENNVEQK